MIIIQDTREQTPWDFSFFGVQQKVQTLKTGDYSIEGMESEVCIERKRSTGEIAINLGSKKKAFDNELDRMLSFKHKYLIFEFGIDKLLSFPLHSGIPKNQQKFIRMNANYMISLLDKIETKYGVEILYCDNSAQAMDVAYSILKEIYEQRTAN